jgi:hypothetical protein
MPAAAPSPTTRLDASRIHLFRADDYDGGESWTTADLDDIVRNHRLLYPRLWRPPIGLGHLRPTPDNAHTADLAFGEVARLWREGPDLWGSYARVSPELERLLKGGYLRSPSVELYRDPSEGNFTERVMPGLRGAMLRRVVYVGAWPQRVKGLAEPSWAAGEMPRLYCTRPGRIFGEKTTMDRDHLMQVAQQAGFGQQFLDGLDDNQLSGLVADLAGRMLGGGDAAGGAGSAPMEPDQDDTGADTGADTMGNTPSRDQMVQDLVAAGQDEQTLQQMDDASLKELWQQMQGGGAAAAGGGSTAAAPSTYGEPARRRGKQMTRTIQISIPTLQSLVAATARTAVARMPRVITDADVVKFCEQMVEEGNLSPAQAERDQRGKPVGPVIKRLLRTSPICFAEGTPSEREQQMEEIRQGGRVRTYGERLPDAPGGTVGGTGGVDAGFEARIKKHYDARLARFGKG